MHMMGSKKRIAKYIIPIILKDRKSNQYYIEPFAGAFSCIENVENPRIANDNNYYLISLFKAVQNVWIPPDIITKEEYINIRDNKNKFPPELVGFVGFSCSFAGKWFAGYARDEYNKRNYCKEGKNSLLKIMPNIQGIQIFNMDYRDLDIPDNSIIYCDPPYANTTNYAAVDKFDHEIFWN